MTKLWKASGKDDSWKKMGVWSKYKIERIFQVKKRTWAKVFI